MKTIWSGSLSFGLVTIPIKLYSAIKAHTLGFRLLHEACNTPLEFKRWCPRCKKEVTWDNTLKGLEQEDGTFFIFTKEKLEQLKPEKTDLISIESFVDHEQIHPIYFENHYYIAPDKKGIKAFFVFQKALFESGKVAIGKLVMREKEYVCSINSYESLLLLNTLYYSYEIRPIKEAFEFKQPIITKKELDLAYKLIGHLTEKKFNLTKYKDEFAEKLKKALKTKKRERPAKKPAPTKRKKGPKEDLSALLQESLRAPARKQRPAYAKKAKSKTLR